MKAELDGLRAEHEGLSQKTRTCWELSALRHAIERSHTALACEADIRVLRDCYTSLTHREREVMALVVSGLLNKQVGGDLGISERTVKAHRGKMMGPSAGSY